MHKIFRYIFFILISLCLSRYSEAQSNYTTPYEVTSIAGLQNYNGYIDGAGTSARFSGYTNGMVCDQLGNVYISDNNLIRKITSTGIVTTIAGNANYNGFADGTGSSARFNGTRGIAVGNDGNIYVIDTNNCTIRKVTPSGVVTTFVGTVGGGAMRDGVGTAAVFQSLNNSNLVLMPSGNFYISDGGTIRQITPAGTVTTLSSYGSQIGGNFAIDSLNNIYWSNSTVIEKTNPSGVTSILAGSLGNQGNADGLGISAQFAYVSSLTIDSNGNIFVIDQQNCTIRKITSAGLVSTIAGQSLKSGFIDGVGSGALFSNGLQEIAADTSGNLYIMDYAAFRKAVIATAPLITTQPTNQAVAVGGSATISVVASGSGILKYQWYKGNSSIVGAASSSYTISSATTTDSGSYYVVVTNSLGSVTSNSVNLTITVGAPVISTQPISQSIYSGSVLNLSVVATGTGPLSYQWFLNNLAISGATTSSYTVASALNTSAGNYTVSVTNAGGSITSSVATISVVTANPPSAPLNVIGTAGNGQVVVSFNPPSNNGGLLITGYTVNVNPVVGGPVVSVTGSSSPIIVTGLTNGVAYNISVTATSSGGTSTAGSVASPIIPVIAPIVTSQPLSITTAATYIVTFATNYSSPTSVTNQWYFNGSAINGATTQNLTLNPISISSSGNYYDVITNNAGSVTTNNAVLNVIPAYRFTTYYSGNINPNGIVFDSHGNLFIVDNFNLVIWKVNPNGIQSVFAGRLTTPGNLDGIGSKATFYNPTSITIDKNDNLYITDSGNRIIRKITPDAMVTTFAGSGNNGSSVDGVGVVASFNNPILITIDSSGNLYVLDSGNIRKITPSASVSTILFNQPVSANCIALDKADNLYFSDYSNIYQVIGNGQYTKFANNVTSLLLQTDLATNQVSGISSMVFDSLGNIFLTSGNLIGIISNNGYVSTIAGGVQNKSGNSDGVGSGAFFYTPSSITLDSNGYIYVTDYNNRSIRRGVNQNFPFITTQPITQTINAGASVSLSVSAAGVPTPNYQWQYNGINIQGATGTTYTINNAQISATGNYDALVTNNLGSVISNIAVVTVVNSAPSIISNPVSQSVFAGQAVTFTAGYSNASSYQWAFNGVGINGATSPSLTLGSVTTNNAGLYSVTAFGIGQPAISSGATLNVTTLPSVISNLTWNIGLSSSLVVSKNISNLNTAIYGLPAELTYNNINSTILGSAVTTNNYGLTLAISNGSVISTIPISLTVQNPPDPVAVDTVGSTIFTNNATQASGISIDGAGNKYFTYGNEIVKMTSNSTAPIVIAGSNIAGALDGAGTSAFFNNPTGITVDSSGNIYIADTSNDVIRKINTSGLVTTIAGFAGIVGSADGVGLSARFNSPRGIVIDNSGNLYVADTGNNAIRKISLSGDVTTLVNSASGISPNSITIAPNGNLYVTSMPTSSYVFGGIFCITPTGAISTITTSIYYSTSSRFGPPNVIATASSIAADYNNNLYVLLGPYLNGNTVGFLYRITSTGQVSLIYSWPSSSILNVPFNANAALAIDSQGNMVIAGPQLQYMGNATTFPKIVSQPQSLSAPLNSSVRFNVIASYSTGYQWQFNGVNIPGATSSSLTLNNVQQSQSGVYTVVVNTSGSYQLTSAPATLTVGSIALPVVTSNPKSQSVVAGSAVTLTTNASGVGLTYQWLYDGTLIAGATASSYTINSSTTANAGNYQVVITDSAGSTTSAIACLGVSSNPTASKYLSSWSSSSPLPATTLYTSAAYDGVNFLVVGTDGTLLSSSNGNSWTKLPSAPGRLNSLVYAGQQYGIIGVGDNGVINSYSEPNLGGAPQASGTTSLLTGFAFSPTRMVAVGYNGTVVTSPYQYALWTSGFSGVNQNLNAVAYGNGTFVAVGLGGTILTSPDGLLWSQQSNGSSTDLYSIAFGPAGFVAIGGSTTGVIYTSPDGITWTQQTSPTSSTLIRVIYANGVYVAVGSLGAIATSVDGGFTWATSNTGTTNTLEGVAYGNNQYIAVGNSGVEVISSQSPTAAPIIINQPLSATVPSNASVTLTASATGGGLSYQWYFNGKAIESATTSTYTISSVTAATSGMYSVTVSNSLGSVSSNAAIVGIPNPGRLVNLSVLSMDGPGSQLLTIGFVTGGAGTFGQQQLLIRGSGPALSAYGVANVLYDPVLTVFDSSSKSIASNDNWGTPSTNVAIINSADSATGAFAYNPTTSLDAALVSSLPVGAYTAQVAGKGTATGNVLAEVYDDTPSGSYTVSVPRLINISCLEQVASGGTLTAGFVVGGTTAVRVLIRASGPTISAAPFNVFGTMPDPKLTVYDVNQNILITNAGWAGNTAIAAAASQVGAFPFANSTSKDSAVLMTLNPGNYTVQASSASGVAGVTLIEVYEVPSN